jgi:hypothetical protein
MCDYLIALAVMAELITEIDVVDTNICAFGGCTTIGLLITLVYMNTNAAVVVVVGCECCLCEASSWK